jgi:hypothetical protein
MFQTLFPRAKMEFQREKKNDGKEEKSSLMG